MFESVHFLSIDKASYPEPAREVVAFGVSGEEVTVFTADVTRSFRPSDQVTSETMSVSEARERYAALRKLGYVKSEKPWAVLASRGSFSVRGFGLATVEGADQWSEGYYRNFHPAGYGTSIGRHQIVPGLVFVTFYRANSCD